MATDLNSDTGLANVVAVADMFSMSRLSSRQSTRRATMKWFDPRARRNASGANSVARRGVKRVVMTSSAAAIAYGGGDRAEPFNEADWTDGTNRDDTSAYGRSKTIAERAAWAWHKAEGGALELVTAIPQCKRIAQQEH